MGTNKNAPIFTDRTHIMNLKNHTCMASMYIYNEISYWKLSIIALNCSFVVPFIDRILITVS